MFIAIFVISLLLLVYCFAIKMIADEMFEPMEQTFESGVEERKRITYEVISEWDR